MCLKLRFIDKLVFLWFFFEEDEIGVIWKLSIILIYNWVWYFIVGWFWDYGFCMNLGFIIYDFLFDYFYVFWFDVKMFV